MKKFLLFLLMALWCHVSFAAIAYVNESDGGDFSGSGHTTQATGALSTTTGNLIVAMVAYNGTMSVNISSVTDTAGNTYTQGPSCWEGFSGTSIATDIWYAKNITGNASNVVTIHYNYAAAYEAVMQIQYSGASTTSPFDQCATGSNTGTTVTTGSFTPSQTGELGVAVQSEVGGGTISPNTSGYSILTGTTTYPTIMHNTSLSGASQTGSFSSTNSGKSITSLAAFIPAAGGGSSISTIYTGSKPIYGSTIN